MEVTTIGLDLGRDVFQVHGIAGDGTVVFNRSIRRRKLLKFFQNIPELRRVVRHIIGRVSRLQSVMMCA